MSKAMQGERRMWSKLYTYDEWMEGQGIPIYRGYYIEDLRTLQLGWWDARECNSAFIQLVGQEGVTSARVTEISPGKTSAAAQVCPRRDRLRRRRPRPDDDLVRRETTEKDFRVAEAQHVSTAAQLHASVH